MAHVMSQARLSMCARTLLLAVAFGPWMACRAPVRRHTGTHLDIRCDASPSQCRDVVALADAFVADVSAALGVAVPPKRLNVLVFESSWAMRSYLSEHCPEQSASGAACFETDDGYAVALVRGWTRSGTHRYLRHELCHYVLASHFCDLPPWVDEGLAQFFEAGKPFGRPDRGQLGSLRTVIRGCRSADLEALVTVPAGAALTRRQYGEAWALTHFLMMGEGYGARRVLSYLKRVHSGPPARKDFRRCFGIWPGELEPTLRLYGVTLSDQPGL